MTQYSAHDAKTQLSKRKAAAPDGDNVQAADLVSVLPRGKRSFGALKGRINIDPRFDESLHEDEIDGWNAS